MKAVYEWEAMLILKDICKEKGWEENKNCKIKYEAKAILLVYNEVHYKGDGADIFYMKNNNPFKQPIFEVHFAKNKFGTYKGRNFFEFYPEMAYMKECDPATQKTYSQIIFG